MLNQGMVFLVGAGPGDPGLITVKGKECLERADVVIYDYLASPGVLRMANPDADLIYVGKSGHHHQKEQSEINALLVEKAREGNIVVRLKGGDSFIFGRGGEEAEVLADAKIPFQVVPGVSSAYAVPAYAGIPVTHRHHSSEVTIVTGQPAKEMHIDWETLAQGKRTLVFLMGVRNLSFIAEKLIEHGKSADTPVAVVRWGTTGKQQVIEGTLSNIPEKARDAALKPPAVTVVGEVVGLRNKLTWFENLPLFGKVIIINRAKDQLDEAVREFEELGAEVIGLPVIEIQPVSDYTQVDEVILRMAKDEETFDWIIFTSANGVKFFRERIETLKYDSRILKNTKIVAIGPATDRKLNNWGIRADMVPEQFVAEGALEAFRKIGVRGQKFLLPRAEVARETLPEGLAEVGGEVVVLPVYRNTPSNLGKEALPTGVSADYVIFTSGSTVTNFIGKFGKEAIGSSQVISIGPATSKVLKTNGVRDFLEATEHTINGIISLIIGNKK